jgi:alkyl sulfatase BDS1-like metallo-beta-lactamase superfamily hydrolase
MDVSSKPASATIVAQHAAASASLPFHDTRDFDAARRGYLGGVDPAVVTDADGTVVWDNDSYAFVAGEAPDTVHPSLWRQSTLVAMQGLYEVVPGIYQVRGLDLSNMTVVEGDTGVLVIDPLISVETAAAALALYREHRGDRPVRAVLYTHSHVDHFGGVRGVTTAEEVASGAVPVIAPEGFMEHAVSENVYAGGAMLRRAGYMYGAALPRGVQGQVGAGLGQTTSTGSVSLIAPTVDITTTGQELVVDGIRMVFQMAPGSEAPAEMHFYFPDHRALCLAENATHTLHNILTLRGAVVRDAHAWSSYLTEALDMFGADAQVAFASHHWPTWGNDEVVEYLGIQRDLYAYLHDQALRLLNRGYVGEEIAEMLTLPEALENAWHARGYYGSVSHNLKAIYQRYLGWYTGNPSQLWKHPPEEAARRYVDYMGGADAVVAKARQSYADGDLRWVAEVLNHVVFADEGHEQARELLADTYEQLGYGSENGTWRDVYLSAAYELRHGSFGTPASAGSPDFMAALTPAQLLDSLAVSIDGPRAAALHLRLDWEVTDTGQTFRLLLRNGVLTYSTSPQRDPATVTIRGPRAGLAAMAAAGAPVDGVEVEGDVATLTALVSVLDPPNPDFAIVTP